MQYETITCPACSSLNIKKNGINKRTKQRYRCNDCGKQFILKYAYRAYLKHIRELVVPMCLNGSGIRDTARVLRISATTVMKLIRQQAANLPPEKLPDRVADVEIDEMWSFVEKKKNQCWLWLAYSPKHRQMLAYSLGKRTDESLRNLLGKLSSVHITRYYTDNWESYQNLIPEVRHWIGKAGTQRIERQNLNFRTHLKRLQRRTICFSKTKKMLEAVIRLYIHQLNSSSISFVT
ncbi:MAG: IS1 family transposase [Acidobacteriota bacterium]|nr:IS1 family transposase [Acidobacteriota bacterium]